MTDNDWAQEIVAIARDLVSLVFIAVVIDESAGKVIDKLLNLFTSPFIFTLVIINRIFPTFE